MREVKTLLLLLLSVITYGVTAQQYTLSVTTIGKGHIETTWPEEESIQVYPAGGLYDSAQDVGLRAIPDSGYILLNWSGDIIDTYEYTSVTMTSDKNVIATFAPDNIANIKIEAEAFPTFNDMSTKDIDAASGGYTMRASSSSTWGYAQYTFTGNTGIYDVQVCYYDAVAGSTSAPYEFYIAGVRLGTWSSNPSNAADLFPIVTYSNITINNGAVIKIQSKKGGSEDRGNYDYVILSGGYPVGAQYSISLTNLGSGTISKSPDKETYSPGETVTLTPNPTTPFSFKKWAGDISGPASPIVIKMYSDMSVSARFSDDTTSVAEAKDTRKEFICFPTQVNDIMNISWYAEKSEQVSIAVLDITGRIVKQVNISCNYGQNTQQIDLSDLRSGMYICSLVNSEGQVSHKIFKQ